MRVDAALGQLLDQPLRLIQGEELGDAHADEGGLLLVDVRKSREERKVTTHFTNAPETGCVNSCTVVGKH